MSIICYGLPLELIYFFSNFRGFMGFFSMSICFRDACMHDLPLGFYMCQMNIIYVLIYLKIISFSDSYHSVLMSLYSIAISSVFFYCFFVTCMFKNRNEFS